MGLVIALTGALYFFEAFQEVRWSGIRNVEFDFLVVDSETQQPIANSTVKLSPEFREELTQVVRTGPDCHACLVRECRSSGQGNTFRDAGMSVDLGPWHVRVEGPGYQTREQVWLLDYRQGIRHERTSTFLPVRLELRGKGRGDESEGRSECVSRCRGRLKTRSRFYLTTSHNRGYSMTKPIASTRKSATNAPPALSYRYVVSPVRR
jgi:hypothetical protein